MDHISKSDLHKFGLTVGLAFVLLGTLSWARGHDLAPRVLWTLGALLVLPGLLAPTLLRPVQRVWMAAAGVLGYVNTRVILGAFFYLILTPIALLLRLVRDPLTRSLDPSLQSCWVKRTPQPVSREQYERQF
ncbi:MAG: sxtJ [Deltaproteobacteria bacterium]|nr:sxtJ [Deltaproteobacteria bacterium]